MDTEKAEKYRKQKSNDLAFRTYISKIVILLIGGNIRWLITLVIILLIALIIVLIIALIVILAIALIVILIISLIIHRGLDYILNDNRLLIRGGIVKFTLAVGA